MKNKSMLPGDITIVDNPFTIRDQFAMAALTGIIANRQPNTVMICNLDRRGRDEAYEAYTMADNMLKAREEKS